MKTLLRLGFAVVLGGVSGGAASANDTVIHAELEEACEMVGSLSGTIPPVAGTYVLGNLGFKCNYSGDVLIGMTADDGTVLRNQDEPTAPGLLYLIQWEVPPAMPFQGSTFAETFGPWPGYTDPIPNEVRSEEVNVWLLNTATIAGTYHDVVTFTVTPN